MEKSTWRFFKKVHDGAWYIVCENCGYSKGCWKEENGEYFRIIKDTTPNYCENCGYKMDVGEDITEARWDPDLQMWVEDKQGE